MLSNIFFGNLSYCPTNWHVSIDRGAYDQAQKDILEMHSLSSPHSYTNEFDVRICTTH